MVTQDPPRWNIWEWKNLKNQKWIHICNAKCYAECYAIYLTKKVLKENTARARLARVWIYKGDPLKNFPSASIFQRNHFKNFFDIIFFPGKSLVKNSKLTFNFTWKSPIQIFLHFLQGNLFVIFPKNYFWDHFWKTIVAVWFWKKIRRTPTCP